MQVPASSQEFPIFDYKITPTPLEGTQANESGHLNSQCDNVIL